MRPWYWSIGAAILLLTACDHPAERPLSPNFGDAVRQNLQAQIINPAPPSDLLPSTMSGERAASAMQRYREHRVIPPSHQSSSSVHVNNDGGGSNGAGGGNVQ